MNTKELLDNIWNEFFGCVSRQEVLKLKKNRFAFVLENVNRLLTTTEVLESPKAVSLANIFWYNDHQHDYAMMVKFNMPLNDEKCVAELSSDDRKIRDFVRETALICFDMLNHIPLEEYHHYNDESAGVGHYYTKWCWDFIQETTLEPLSAYAAYGFLKGMKECVELGLNYAIYDFMSRPWSQEKQMFVEAPVMRNISVREYVGMVVETVNVVSDHMNEGYALGLCDDEIACHDEFCGRFMREYVPEVVEVARKLHRYKLEHVMIKDEEYDDIIDHSREYKTQAHAEIVAKKSEQGKALIKRKVDAYMEYVRQLRADVDPVVWKAYEPLSEEYMRESADINATLVDDSREFKLWE